MADHFDAKPPKGLRQDAHQRPIPERKREGRSTLLIAVDDPPAGVGSSSWRRGGRSSQVNIAAARR